MKKFHFLANICPFSYEEVKKFQIIDIQFDNFTPYLLGKRINKTYGQVASYLPLLLRIKILTFFFKKVIKMLKLVPYLLKGKIKSLGQKKLNVLYPYEARKTK